MAKSATAQCPRRQTVSGSVLMPATRPPIPQGGAVAATTSQASRVAAIPRSCHPHCSGG
uniref:Uncharacterized protein n=1 Tax=Anguilla anguilla TaxID=7936 RepID=A0A0E9STJ1_ANGAN